MRGSKFIFVIFSCALCFGLKAQGLKLELPLENLEHYTVFTSGSEGYHTYRIPTVIQAKNGTLIAIAEGRRDNRGDPGWGHIDLVYKLSKDGGRNWSPVKVLSKSEEGGASSNPTALVLKNGRIVLFHGRFKPGRGGNKGERFSRPGTLDNQLWCKYSEDNGHTWSEPHDITSQARDIDKWGYVSVGIGHGIETRTGRIIMPAIGAGFLDDPTKKASFALYSDDGGQSWERGNQIEAFTTENQIVELENGNLMINARQKEEIGSRWVATSTDQGLTWSKPRPGQVCAQICAGFNNYSLNGKSLLLWTGIKGPGRTNLVLQLSSDNGLTFPVQLIVAEGPAGYSVLSPFGKKKMGIIWEGGEKDYREKIFYTMIPQKTIKRLYHATKK